MDIGLASAAVAGGLVAGAMNAVVGAGSLVSFPLLLAAGMSPLAANVTNTVGLTAGSSTAVRGYRRELAGQWPRVLRLAVWTLAGSIVGAVLLLAFPERAFEVLVPPLLLLSGALTLLQPRMARWAARRQAAGRGSRALVLGVLLTGVYCGYFGAAQGVILLALLASFYDSDIQRANGAKNVLALVGNLTAAVIFAFTAPVDWAVAGLEFGGAIVGGLLGVRLARRLKPLAFRVFAGTVAAVAAVVLTVQLVT